MAVDAAAQGIPPVVQIAPADNHRLPGQVDSNSPGVWSTDGSTYIVFTSYAGLPQRATGPSLFALGDPAPVAFDETPDGGTWMEAVVRDSLGVLYGYYHNEVPDFVCNGPRMRPRVGAARSVDDGVTWQNLGVIWESSEPSKCDTTNGYFYGGVGDVSVMLDPGEQFLYMFYSAYGESLAGQGVSVARLAWSDRDAPSGAFAVWQNGAWVRPTLVETPEGTPAWVYPTGTPIYPALASWHGDDGVTDAFWGPAIHWNTYLQSYVMLINHSDTVAFNQEGIYIGYASTLDNPAAWTAPERLLEGGSWYPQVMGLESASGTDKLAGQSARFYMSGDSNWLIQFGDAPPPPPPGTLPSPFGKSEPGNGATGISLNPTLGWGPSAAATSYKYCIDTSNNSTCNAAWVDVGGSTSVALAGLAGGTMYSWQVRGVNANGMTPADAGTWWTFTTAALPNPLADLTIDFGTGLGLWTYYDVGGSPTWQPIHGSSPSLLTCADLDGNGLADLVMDFPGYGVWAHLNNATWLQIHPFDAAAIKAGDLDGNGRDDLLISFSGLGLWIRYDNGTWAPLSPLNPTAMAVGNIDGGAGGRADVIVQFAGQGLWVYYNDAAWQHINNNTATDLQLGDLYGNGVSDLLVQFSGLGEWVLYNSTSWRQLHPTAAAGIVTGNIDGDAGGRADAVINFPGLGVWAFMNNASWVPLHPSNSPVMTTGDLDGNGTSDIVMFLPGFGIYALQNFSTWIMIHPLPPELMVTGRMNAN